MLGFKSHRDIVGKHDDISDHKAVPNTQYGTNPGGVHISPTGEKHYVKFYRNPEQAHAEVTSSKLMEHMGASTLKPRIVTHNGRIGVATKWRDDLHEMPKHAYNAPSEGMKHELAKHYVAGILTKNWDTVGMEYDNLKRTPDHKLVSVDQGGSMHFRAQGGPKDYSRDIGEHSSYHDKGLNPQAAHAFSSLTHEHIHKAFKEMTNHSDESIHQIFAASGLPNAQHHAKTFVTRRNLLGKQLSEDAKRK